MEYSYRSHGEVTKTRLENRRGHLVIGILSGFLGVALSQSATAQETSNASEELEEVVVMGIRSSLQRAVDIKRESATIVDAISAEDVGKFPDLNLAESLQRITGVQIARLRGEGRTVNIRGLPSEFSRVQLNGRTLPSALHAGESVADSAASRSFDFTALPSEFVRTLEVHKAPTAYLQEGGLSGTIVVRTPRPFDYNERRISGSAQAAWNSNSNETSPRLSGIYSDVFGDGQWGISVGVAHFERRPETHELNLTGFNNSRTEDTGTTTSGGPLDFNGNGVIDPGLLVEIPDLVFLNLFTEERKRSSAFAAFQARPTDNLELTVDAYYTELDFQASRFENLYIPRLALGPTVPEGIVTQTVNGNERAVRFEADNTDLRGGSRFDDRQGETLSAAAGLRYETGPWSILGEIAISESEQIRDNLNIANIALGRVAIDAGVDPEMVSVIHGAGFEQGRLDPNNFRIASLNGEFQRKSRDHQDDFGLDIERELDFGALSKLKFGARYTAREQFQDNGRLVVPAPAFADLVGGLPEGPLPGSVSAAPFMMLIEPSNGSFLGAYSGTAVFPQQWLGSNTAGFLETVSDAELIAAGNFTNDPSGIVDVEEDVTAAYAMVDFGDADGLLSGNFGVRVVQTKQTSRGSVPDLTGITFQPEASEITTIPILSGVTVEHEYTDVLPSANLRLNLTDDLVLRFAANRTMSRAPLTDVSPSASANGTAATISQKNPYLDPFRSNNFDVSAEWYLAGGGLLSAAYFYKDIVSLVTLETRSETLPVLVIFGDGSTLVEPLDFQITTPVNGSGVTVEGVELAYQQWFENLSGFLRNTGVSANYTYIGNSNEELLTGSSKHNYNVAALYESERFALRLSYTWRDDFLISPTAGFGDGVGAKARGTLDGNIAYNINENFSVVLEAINILDDADLEGFLIGFPKEFTDIGRSVLIGARATF